MNMKTATLITSLLLNFAVTNLDNAWAQEQQCEWQQVFHDTAGAPQNFFAITSSGIGKWHIAGSNGTVCKSVDDGQTWTSQTTGSNATLNDAIFISEGNGFIVGGDFNNSANILRTTDGGQTYSESVLTGLNSLFGIDFIDANNGWTFGVDGLLLRTTDSGNTWLAQPSGTTEWLLDIAFVDQTTAVIVGGNGTILRTTNGGLSWLPVASGTTEWLTGVSALVNTTLFAVGNGGTILSSGDSGQTWTPRTSGTSEDLSDISFRDENNGTAVGNNGTILSTTDGGETWDQQFCTVSSDFHKVHFTGSVGLGVGDFTTIFRTETTPVWYVDNSLGQNGDGSINSPFNNEVDAQTASKDGDTIFLHSGISPYGGIALKNNQSLFGQGVPLVANGQILVEAGTPPVISNPGGTGITLANNTKVAGLNISDVNVGISGTNVDGEFNFSEFGLSGEVSFGVALSNAIGLYNFETMRAVDVIVSAPGATIQISGGSANHTFDAASTIQQTGGTVVQVAGGHTGTLDYFGTISATNSNGLQFDNADGTYNLNGDVTLNGGKTGIGINNSNGTFNFGRTRISDMDSTGVSVRNSNANVTYKQLEIDRVRTGIYGEGGTFTSSVDSMGKPFINATGGPALFFKNCQIDLNFGNLFSTNSIDYGLSFMNVRGSLTVLDSTIVRNSGSHSVNMESTSGTYSLEAFLADKALGDGFHILNPPGEEALNLQFNSFTATLIEEALFSNNFKTGDVYEWRRANISDTGSDAIVLKGSGNGQNTGSGGVVNFGDTKIKNAGGRGVVISNVNADVTFGKLDIDGAQSGVRIDSLAGKFAITGDGTPGSGGTMEDCRLSYIRASPVREVEVRDLRLNSDFIVDSFFDVFVEVSVDGLNTTRSTTNSFSKNSSSQFRVVLANSSFTSANDSPVNIEVGGTVAADIELIGNTITTTGADGITVQTSDSSSALVMLTGNDVSAVANDFVLVQDSSSTFQLAGFAGGDSTAVAAFIQDNNVGTPSVAVSGTISADPTTSVDEPKPTVVPTAFRLAQNYPNPFNPTTTIRFALPRASDVSLEIFGITGQRVRSLADTKFQAGEYEIVWDARDDSGRALPSGLYVTRIQAGDFTSHRKMLLVK